LAQKCEYRPPGTAGSMWSARSTSAGMLGAESCCTSAMPTPPATAKPAKATPSHRLARVRPEAQSDEQQERKDGRHLVNEQHDPNRLRMLDQQRLRRKFLKNMQTSKERDRQTKQSEAVLQEYYWRMRDMEVEKNCRKIERTWQQREKQRQADAESKRKEFAEKSDEFMNQQYGRIFISPYSQPLQKQTSREQPEASYKRSESELAMESVWDAAAQGVFQAAYHEAVGRFVTPSPETTEQMTQGHQGVSITETQQTTELEGISASVSTSARSEHRSSRLKMLPVGRVAFESPRNPWCAQKTAAGQHIYMEKAKPARRTQSQALTRWKQLPPVWPERAVQEMARTA